MRDRSCGCCDQIPPRLPCANIPHELCLLDYAKVHICLLHSAQSGIEYFVPTIADIVKTKTDRTYRLLPTPQPPPCRNSHTTEHILLPKLVYQSLPQSVPCHAAWPFPTYLFPDTPPDHVRRSCTRDPLFPPLLLFPDPTTLASETL